MTAIQDLVLTFCSTVRPVLSVFLITRDFEWLKVRGDTSWRLLNPSCTLLLAILALSEFLESSSYVCFPSRAGAVRLENRGLQEPWVFRYDFNCPWNNHCSTSSYMKTLVVQRRSSLKEVIVAMILRGNLEKFRSILNQQSNLLSEC